MGPAIGDILPFAVGAAISPMTIMVVILMLFTSRARSNSLAFLAGWAAGMAILVIIMLVISDNTHVSGSAHEPSTATSAIRELLGLMFLFLAWRNWSSRPTEGDEPKLPGWMQRIESARPAVAIGLGALLSISNVKNLALTHAAAVATAQAGLSVVGSAVALAVFVAIGSMGVAAPIVLYLALGERAEKTLNQWKVWLQENNATVMAVVFLVLGAVFIGQGMRGLTD